MSLSSFMFRVRADNGQHVEVTVFAGPDEQHRACAGHLTFRPAEWEDFKARLGSGPGFTIQEASQ